MPASPPELTRPQADEPSRLLRVEAVDALRDQQYSEVFLLPSAWSRWTAVAALALVAGMALLLAFGSYTRRSTVVGQLLPSQGLIRVTAPQAGRVIERPVREGQSVRKGDVLYVISSDRAGHDAAAYQQMISRQIDARRRSLEEELSRLDSAGDSEQAQLLRRIESLRSERAQIDWQTQLSQARVPSAEDSVLRHQEGLMHGAVSRDQLRTRENELADLRARLVGLRREGLALDRELTAAQREVDGVRARVASRRSELERSVMQVRQEFAEVEAQRRVVITAPADGQVTLLRAGLGQSVDPNKSLAHLVPAGSTLVAQLYVPSRSAGFVRPGTRVDMRYDAFPYQKFGQHHGIVATVSDAAVSAEELSAMPVRLDVVAENHFAVTVQLPAMLAGGDALPLQAGMRLEADLLHDTRPLYQWVLEPLYGAHVRLKGP